MNISSLARRISDSPLGRPPYCASKWALEAISEALAGEVKPFGIRVAIVEPGIQDTRMARGLERPDSSKYPHSRRFAGLFRAAFDHSTPPETTAAIVRQAIESGSWQLRYPSGPDAAGFLSWRAAMTDEQWVDWSVNSVSTPAPQPTPPVAKISSVHGGRALTMSLLGARCRWTWGSAFSLLLGTLQGRRHSSQKLGFQPFEKPHFVVVSCPAGCGAAIGCLQESQ